MPRATSTDAVRKASAQRALTSADHAARDAAEKNRPLVDDIRLLGRILGDVIREQEGQAAFDLVERIRSSRWPTA